VCALARHKEETLFLRSLLLVRSVVVSACIGAACGDRVAAAAAVVVPVVLVDGGSSDRECARDNENDENETVVNDPGSVLTESTRTRILG